MVAVANHKLTPARTECVDLPWKDCADLIDATPNWVFWHPWPDSMVHDGAGAGQGLDTVTRDAAERLSSDEFWGFVERLAIGRRVVITSDHGYAATGLFFDAGDEQARLLEERPSRAAASSAASTTPAHSFRLSHCQ